MTTITTHLLPIPRDGSCFYHCIVRALYNTELFYNNIVLCSSVAKQYPTIDSFQNDKLPQYNCMKLLREVVAFAINDEDFESRKMLSIVYSNICVINSIDEYKAITELVTEYVDEVLINVIIRIFDNRLGLYIYMENEERVFLSTYDSYHNKEYNLFLQLGNEHYNLLQFSFTTDDNSVKHRFVTNENADILEQVVTHITNSTIPILEKDESDINEFVVDTTINKMFDENNMILIYRQELCIMTNITINKSVYIHFHLDGFVYYSIFDKKYSTKTIYFVEIQKIQNDAVFPPYVEIVHSNDIFIYYRLIEKPKLEIYLSFCVGHRQNNNNNNNNNKHKYHLRSSNKKIKNYFTPLSLQQ